MRTLLAFLLLIPMLVATASASTGFNVIPILATNETGAAITAPQIPFNMSSVQLVNGSWMNSTALNTELQDASSAVGYMPGTGQVRMLACFNNAAVDQTAACNNATAGDITLPAAAAQIYEFAADSQFRHLWLNISTAGVATWDLAFEYWNGAAYVAFAGVTDGTNELTIAGLNQVAWTFPAAGLWDESLLHGVTGYWMRIRVSAFTALTTAPLGQQAYWETGRWWTTVPSIANNEQRRFDLHLDTAPTETTTTTFSIAATADDAFLSALSAAYPPAFSGTATAGDVNVANTFAAGPLYLLTNGFLRFDTSTLPDQISPDSATIACHVSVSANADSRSVVAEWYPWSGTLGEKDYNSTAINNAMAAVTIASITSGAVNTWTLQNLHRINKSGYTGLRFAVTGGVPAGVNEITLRGTGTTPVCVLSVTYDGSRAYHDLFPINAGYTLADTAALEPGSAYAITWAGFITSNIGAGSFILVKGTAIQIASTATPGTLDVFINGVNELDFTGVTTGYHVLTLRQVAAGGAYRTEALTDGVITGTSAAALAIADNATAWTVAALPVIYQEYLEMQVAGVTQLTHQVRALPTYQVINQANPGVSDSNVRYPETVAFDVTVLSMEPTGATFSDAVAPSGDFVAPVSELTNLEATEHLNTPTFPVFMLLRWGADNSNGALPYQATLIMFAFILCVIATVGSWYALHSVHITWIALLAASVSFIFVGSGIWTWMVPFSVAVTGAVYIFYRRTAV